MTPLQIEPLRVRWGFSAKELAQVLGVTPTTTSRWSRYVKQGHPLAERPVDDAFWLTVLDALSSEEHADTVRRLLQTEGRAALYRYLLAARDT
jgi:hypothetical protein